MPDSALVRVPDGLAILPPEAPAVEVLAVTRPLGGQRLYARLPDGRTITEILGLLGLPPGTYARVFIDDWLVPPAWWPHVKPKPGRRVTIRVIPSGGGQGGDDNKVWRTVLLVVVLIVAIVVSIFLPPTIPGWVALLITSGIMLAGTLLVNFVIFPIPPPSISRLPGSNLSESPSLTITGARNQANPYGVIPRVFGTYRIFPPYGAQPFTELLGNDQYLRMLFIPGTGPLAFSDLKIGETPIGQFAGIEVETRAGYPDDPPLTLFPRQADEMAFSIYLSAANSWQTRTSVANADELSVDIVFPNGLGALGGRGARFWWTVDVEVQYAAAGTGAWIAAGTISASDGTQRSVYRGLRWPVTRGQYDVRLRRTTFDTVDVPIATLRAYLAGIGRLDLVNAIDDGGSISIGDLCYWSTLRSFTNEDPVVLPGLAKIAIRIKATEQLNGMIDSFNCVATAILPDWDAASGTWITRATRSPVAAYRAVLQGPENPEAVTDDRLDLPSLQAWAEACTAWGFCFDHVVDYQTTVFELLRLIAGSARGAFSMLEDRYGAIFERAQTVPIQFFTPRNSREFKGMKMFPDPIHALKMHFVNPDKSWQQDERIVYDDGYNADGSGGLTAATTFETVNLPGTTDSVQAYKHGRYHLAQVRLRPELYELVTDIENLVCTRGDLVHVAHDVPLWGLGWGRVTRVDVALTGDMTALAVDEPFPMETGKTYTVRIRAADGTSRICPVTTVAGAQKTVTFSSPVAPPLAAVGDMVMFGETGLETTPLLVKMITPMADFLARIQLVDAAPDIVDADTGPIPPWDSHITQPPVIERFPPAPAIESVRSDEAVLLIAADGSAVSRIQIILRTPPSGSIPADFLEVRFRETGSVTWIAWGNIPADATEVSITDVQDGHSYDIRLRAGTTLGLRSDWTQVNAHLVIGKTSAPPDVAAFQVLVDASGARLVWSYDTPPRDFAGFHLRYTSGTTGQWTTALPLHGTFVTPTTFTLPTFYGPWMFFIKAFDVVGNESVTAASVAYDFGDARLLNVVESSDQRALGWPGALTNCSVDLNGDLAADSATLMWTGPAAPFWHPSDASVFWTGTYLEMAYQFGFATAALTAGARALFEWAVQGGGWRLEYQRPGDTLWLAWAGELQGILGGVTYQFRVTINAGTEQGILEQLRLFFDAPDIEDTFSNVAIADTGTRLTLPRVYRTIKTVIASTVFDGGTAVTAQPQDRDATLGPLIKTLNAAGTAVAGHADARIVGY